MCAPDSETAVYSHGADFDLHTDLTGTTVCVSLSFASAASPGHPSDAASAGRSPAAPAAPASARKYHLAGLSASSISIRLGLCLQALGLLDHRLLVLAHKLRAEELRNRRHEAARNKKHSTQRHTSMRQVEPVTGVTVVRLGNHLSPQRMISVRRLGSTKSMVVSIGWP